SGPLALILVEPGATVAVSSALDEIGAGARPGEAHPDEHNGRPAPDPSGGSHRVEPSTADGGSDRSGFYSPVVRRIAAKHGIDLARVKGTGIGGRVRKKDVLAHLAQGGGPTVSQEPMLHIESPYRPEHATAPAGSGSPGPG